MMPEKQMRDFRFMVDGVTDGVEFLTVDVQPGDRVKVVRGTLKGLECELLCIEQNNYVAIRLNGLGVATVRMSIDNIEKI